MTPKHPIEALALALPSLTPRQANVVWEFLQHIAAAVWEAHEADLLDLYAADDIAATADDQDLVDDVPF